jgi:hypothetical protein
MMPTKHAYVHDLGKVLLATENYVQYQGEYLLHRRSLTKSSFPGFLVGPVGRIVSFITRAELNTPPEAIQHSIEGTSEWLSIPDLLSQDKVFPPSKYYFEHVLHNRPGIIHANSEWSNSELVRVLSQTVAN